MKGKNGHAMNRKRKQNNRNPVQFYFKFALLFLSLLIASYSNLIAREGDVPAVKPKTKTTQEQPPDSITFGHRVITGFRTANSKAEGLPSEDLYEMRIIFHKFFRGVLMRDLVDHKSSYVNPYYIDVNYRNRRIPRNIEINQGDDTDFNIEINRAAFNLLGYAHNRGFLAGVGIAVEKVFPFRTSDKHFAGLHPMMRLTDQQHHAFDFILSGAKSQVIDREYSTHYGGTIAYTYYYRYNKNKHDIYIKLPITFYGFAMTDYLKRTSDNTVLENIWLDGIGHPFNSFQIRDLQKAPEPRLRDVVALNFKPELKFSKKGIILTLYSFYQQEEIKETAHYAQNKKNAYDYREDGIGYETDYFRYGLEFKKVFKPARDYRIRIGTSYLSVARSYHVNYEVDLDAATLQPGSPIASGLMDIISDCGYDFSGLTQRYSCRRRAHDSRTAFWLELEILSLFVSGRPAPNGKSNETHDKMYFRLSAIRYGIGRDPQTNLFSDENLNKMIFPGELEALPLPTGALLQRENSSRPDKLTRNEIRFDLVYELAGFEFTYTVP